MPLPTPVVTAPPDLIDLPVGGTYQFDGTSSTPGVSYTWLLVERPEGSTATLSNPTSAQPTLTNVDTRGTYIVFLKVTNSEGTSHPYPYPTQAATPPYAFTPPLATAFGVLRIAEEGNPTLFKPGRGEYGWFEKGLWPLFDKVAAGAEFEYYDKPTRTLTANAIVPDGEDTVTLNGLNVQEASPNLIVTNDDSGAIIVASALNVTGADLRVDGGVLRADEIRDASGGNIDVIPNAGFRVTAGEAVYLEGQGVEITSTSDQIDMLVSSARGMTLSAEVGDVLITAGDDITLSTLAENGDVSIEAAGIGGDVQITAGDDITLTVTAADSQIILTAPGADAVVALTAAGSSGQVRLTAGDEVRLGASADINMLAGNALTMVAVAAADLTTSNGDARIFVGGNAEEETEDNFFQVSFDAQNVRRVVDLDGFVAKRNNSVTLGASLVPVTPAGGTVLVPLRANHAAEYAVQALRGPESVSLNFGLSFYAAFRLESFASNKDLTFALYAGDGTSEVLLVSFPYLADGAADDVTGPVIIQGIVTSTGGKLLVSSGTLTMTIDSSRSYTTSGAQTIDATAVTGSSATLNFFFKAFSNSMVVEIANLHASFSLLLVS